MLSFTYCTGGMVPSDAQPLHPLMQVASSVALESLRRGLDGQQLAPEAQRQQLVQLHAQLAGLVTQALAQAVPVPQGPATSGSAGEMLVEFENV